MIENSSDLTHCEVLSPAKAAALLRTLVDRLARGEVEHVLVGRGDTPEAVLLPFADYRHLLQVMEDVDARELSERLSLAPEPGHGITTEALEAMVTDGLDGGNRVPGAGPAAQDGG
ncbi:hypothetical protein [Kitasatospora aureofaciens]|uniref:hypothetical protein n=1 Tax=Kitasatospora aureofaciens TaxID=1894 RepID=UPI00131D5FA4|nr:hypothetical protein [Kitasatospora aureofaciens]